MIPTRIWISNKSKGLIWAIVTTLALVLSTSISAIASNSGDASSRQSAFTSTGNNGRSDSAPGHSESASRGQSGQEHGNGSIKSGNGGGKKDPNDQKTIALNLLLNTKPTKDVQSQLEKFGSITSVLEEISAVTIRTKYGQIPNLVKTGLVSSYNEDQERLVDPILEQSESNSATFSDGYSSWNLDLINVTDGVGSNTTRVVSQTGTGAYVAVIDTGLLKDWRAYFNESSIATEYAIAFGGGGGEQGTVSTQPNKWERDQDSHGTHVTSTILGFRQPTRTITGVAPGAKVIPVKVLNQNGSGWSSVVAAGILYVAELKQGPLSNSPVVINMSLGGPTLDVVEKAAIDYAIANGVIVVASAGNSGSKGMGFPGAYAPVISVAAAGWTGEWTSVATPGSWWRSIDVAENGTAEAYVTSFSSRQLSGQQLDVAAPGSWIVGPYQTNGQFNWYFLGGTSMASPHVAGLAALMLQKNRTLSQSMVESKLKSTATAFTTSSAMVRSYYNLTPISKTWGTDATGAGLINAVSALAAVSAQP